MLVKLVKCEKCDQTLYCDFNQRLEFIYLFLISYIALSYTFQQCLFLLWLFLAQPIAQTVGLRHTPSTPSLYFLASPCYLVRCFPLSSFSWVLKLLPEILRSILVHRWCSQEVLGLLGHQKTKQTVEYVECGACQGRGGMESGFHSFCLITRSQGTRKAVFKALQGQIVVSASLACA